jgi:hypothetical protein
MVAGSRSAAFRRSSLEIARSAQVRHVRPLTPSKPFLNRSLRIIFLIRWLWGAGGNRCADTRELHSPPTLEPRLRRNSYGSPAHNLCSSPSGRDGDWDVAHSRDATDRIIFHVCGCKPANIATVLEKPIILFYQTTEAVIHRHHPAPDGLVCLDYAGNSIVP